MGYNLKYQVIILIKIDRPGFAFTVHSDTCKQYVQSLQSVHSRISVAYGLGIRTYCSHVSLFMMKLIVGLISVVLKFLYQNYETTHMLIYRYNSLITSYV